MLALLGGTFDPPHMGHLVAGQAALDLPGVERVLFMPAGQPWRKAGSGVTGAEQRLAMVELAIAGNAGFRVDDREVRRTGGTYTVETLEELATEGIERPYLVLGGDALADMRHWHRHEELPTLARIVVAPRASAEAPPGYEVLDMPSIGISSSEIRRRVREGLSIRYLAPDAVVSYIEHHGLYR